MLCDGLNFLSYHGTWLLGMSVAPRKSLYSNEWMLDGTEGVVPNLSTSPTPTTLDQVNQLFILTDSLKAKQKQLFGNPVT